MHVSVIYAGNPCKRKLDCICPECFSTNITPISLWTVTKSTPILYPFHAKTLKSWKKYQFCVAAAQLRCVALGNLVLSGVTKMAAEL